MNERLSRAIGPAVELNFERIPELVAQYINYLSARNQPASRGSGKHVQAPEIAVTIGRKYYVATVCDARFDTTGICRSLCLRVPGSQRPNSRDFFVIVAHDDYLEPPRWGFVYGIQGAVSLAIYNRKALRSPFPQLEER